MKKSFFLFLTTALFSITITANVNWMTSFDAAKKLSLVTGKPILIDFYADWCGPCRKMDFDVWAKPDIKQLLQNFVAVKINIDYNKSVARKYGVRGIPNILILDSFGNRLMSQVGYQDKNRVGRYLKNYSFNLKLVNTPLAALKKDKDNFMLQLRVGQKFQDIAFMLDGDAKNALLRKSSSYFKSAKKQAKKKSSRITQKIELLELYNKVLHKKYNSTLKKLNNFSDVEQSSQSLYYFLRYLCFKNLNDETSCTETLEQLKKAKYNKGYLSKIEYLNKLSVK